MQTQSANTQVKWSYLTWMSGTQIQTPLAMRINHNLSFAWRQQDSNLIYTSITDQIYHQSNIYTLQVSAPISGYL